MEIKFSKRLVEDARKIREEVFVQEQGFKNEFDEIDKSATHVVVYKDAIPVATGRMYEEQGVYHIGRLAVCKEYRKQHLGAQLMKVLEDKIKEQKGTTIVLSAQKQAQGFYQKMGYQIQGEEYLDEHCMHIEMQKRI